MTLGGVNSSELDQLLRIQQLGTSTTSTTGTEESGDEAISFSSGSEETSSIEDIEAAYAEAAEAYTSGTSSTSSTSATSGTSATSSTSSTGATSEEIAEEIEELEEQKEENIEKMEKIEAEIEDLAEAAEKNITEAAKAQESAVEEHEEETQEAVGKCISDYVEANKEGGEGMTREELQSNIEGSLSEVPEVAAAVSALVEANEQINEIDSLLGDLNDLIVDTQDIESQIEVKTEEYDAAVEAEEAAEYFSTSGCCDPIGFTMGEGEDAVSYDFIVDDGSFDSTSDFLGSEDQWAAMEALDTDGDGSVTSAELSAGNIKAVKTSADGSQEVVDLAEEFGDDFSIDLTSYTEGGSYSGIDTTTDSDGDGTADQSLLGTFNLNVNGETISGYNTLDDTDYLADSYGVSGDTTSAVDSTEASTGLDASQFSEDLQSHVNFFNTYTEVSENLKAELEGAWEDLGLTEDSFKELNEAAVKEADSKAESFIKSLDTEDEEDEETVDGEETTVNEDSTSNTMTEAIAASDNISTDDTETDYTTSTTEDNEEEEEELELRAA